MKKITQSNIFTIAVLSFLLALCATSYAQVQTTFTPRYTESIRGDMTTIGNTTISRHPINDYHGQDGNHDFNNNVYVDIDADNTTFNSSSANFSNPNPNLNCLAVRRVYLYWAASDKETNGNDNQPNWNYNDVKLMLPGESAYTTYTSDDVIYRGRNVHFSNDPYVCVKDITTEVLNLSSPYGTYQVANVEGKIGGLTPHPNGNSGVSGGWQIVFVYTSPDLAMKNISVFDGYAHVTDSNNNFDINFNGFQTTPTGPVNATIVLGSLEGDRDLDGDKLQFLDTSNTFVDLTAPLRASDNFFNSRITVGNTDFLDRVPASTNTLGFDATAFSLDNPGNTVIDNNQTSATIRLTSDQETYGLYLMGLSVDVWAPSLYPITLDSDAINNTTQAGNSVIFDFNFENTGNDDAINVVLHTTLPTNLEFIGANNLPAGVTYTYDINTRLLQFFVEDGLVDIGDPAINIEFEVEIREECYFLEQSCDLGFELQIEANYNGVNNPAPVTTLSSSGQDLCHLGTVLPITIDQPAMAQWATSAGDLDRTVTCETPNDLTAAQALFPVPDKCNFTVTKTSGTFVPDANSCGSSGTYTNTFNFTDACGRTIADYVQVITLVDDTPPVLGSLPADQVIDCSDTPNFVQPTVTDACSANINLTYNDVITNSSCSFDYTITRTWTAIDDCNNQSTVSQTFIIQDTTAPTFVETLPQDQTVTCGNVPPAATLTATDNCGNPTVSFNETRTDGACASDYTITRTWTATDECGNELVHTQTIYIEDTTPPTLVGNIDPELFINCNLPPDPPNLNFIDNCSSNLDVIFSEEIIEIDFYNFDLIRTWEVYDDCANMSSYSQVLHMETIKSNAVTQLNLCENDRPIDLSQYFPVDTPGYWEGNSSALINNNILDPLIVGEGNYTLSYIDATDNCIEIVRVEANIGPACEKDDNCIRSPFDVDISKIVTPNGDLKNQTFEVAYVLNPNVERDNTCDIIIRVKMFNRWGNKVFESRDYQNDWEGVSDGRVGAAQVLPAGTYYYVVELVNSGLRPIQGYILLGTEQ